ncbi:Uncharacterised protein r2_g256 [Pycnogonum litorale]
MNPLPDCSCDSVQVTIVGDEGKTESNLRLFAEEIVKDVINQATNRIQEEDAKEDEFISSKKERDDERASGTTKRRKTRDFATVFSTIVRTLCFCYKNSDTRKKN